MAKAPTNAIAIEDAVALALFAQRSPNAEFREGAFALALLALANGSPSLADLTPLCEFAARTKARGPSAERAREVGSRLAREAGRAEMLAQFTESVKSPPARSGRAGRRPASGA